MRREMQDQIDALSAEGYNDRDKELAHLELAK